MKTIQVSTELDAPAHVVWPAVKTPHAFVHVAKGMVRYPAAENVARPWQVGDEIRGWTFLFGVIPFSRHRLAIESVDDDRFVLISDEDGGLLRTWHHTLAVTPLDEGHCRYEDRIRIDAGPLTPVVAAYAAVFYRYRQWRWRTLARLLAATAQGSETVHSSKTVT